VGLAKMMQWIKTGKTWYGGKFGQKTVQGVKISKKRYMKKICEKQYRG